MTDKAQDVLALASSMFVSMRRLFAIQVKEDKQITKQQIEESLKELKHNN